MKLVVATHNKGKIAEFAHMLADLQLEWLSLDEAGVTADVEETGLTFSANAWLKAEAYAQQTGLMTLADDSGLEVDALGGEPGVYTARYGGAELSHQQRYELLLANLAAVPAEMRTARFRCVIAVAAEDGRHLLQAEGVCEGHIAHAPAGEFGFGYDPVFVPLGEDGRTMAQIPPERKHQISHRGRALAQLVPQLRALLHSNL